VNLDDRPDDGDFPGVDEAEPKPRKVLPFCLTGPPLGAIPVPDYDVRRSDVLLIEVSEGALNLSL
jgi:hypothetical protein